MQVPASALVVGIDLARESQAVSYVVPDVRAPGFADEAHSQAVAVAQSEHSEADQEFIDAVSEFSG